LIEESNRVRELVAKQFGNPNEEHWLELAWYVGYWKKNKDIVKLTYRKPKDLQVLSNVDSNYATDKETRKSDSGAIHTMGGTIVNWLSKTQQSVSHYPARKLNMWVLPAKHANANFFSNCWHTKSHFAWCRE
jgi:hypothetical protein